MFFLTLSGSNLCTVNLPIQRLISFDAMKTQGITIIKHSTGPSPPKVSVCPSAVSLVSSPPPGSDHLLSLTTGQFALSGLLCEWTRAVRAFMPAGFFSNIFETRP